MIKIISAIANPKLVILLLTVGSPHAIHEQIASLAPLSGYFKKELEYRSSHQMRQALFGDNCGDGECAGNPDDGHRGVSSQIHQPKGKPHWPPENIHYLSNPKSLRTAKSTNGDSETRKSKFELDHIQAAEDDSELSSQEGAINRVLEIDAVISKQRNLLSTSVSLDAAVKAYLLGLDAIDFSKCTEKFQLAFRSHRQAWERAIPLLTKHNSLRGEMHTLFDQIKAGSEEDKAKLEGILADITQTWKEVELAAKTGSKNTPQEAEGEMIVRINNETYEYLTRDRLDSADLTSLVSARRQVWEAWFAGNTKRLEELCPSETVTGDSTNPDWLRLQRVLDDSKAFAASGAVLESLVFDHNLVQVYDNVAILYVDFHGATNSANKSSAMSGRAVEVFVKREQTWHNSGWFLSFNGE